MFKSTAILLFIFSSFAFTLGNDQASEFIVGGEKAREGQFPYAVSLGVIEPAFIHVCGGSILNHRWILTVANR
jgi:secreted trypsin-like serine protease